MEGSLVRFSKLGSMILASVLVLGGPAACGVDVSGVPAPARDTIYEGYRAEAERTLRGLGFSDTVVVIEDEPIETTAAPSKKATSPSPSTSTAPKTKKVIEAKFSVPGTKCAGNVEQELEPVGKMYFAEVILPDGTEKDVKSKAPALTPLDIFTYVHNNFVECAIEGITTPPLVIPTAS